jgi:hypothetical protein
MNLLEIVSSVRSEKCEQWKDGSSEVSASDWDGMQIRAANIKENGSLQSMYAFESELSLSKLFVFAISD